MNIQLIRRWGKKRKRKQKIMGQIESNDKAVDLNLKISIVTINIKGLSTLNKSKDWMNFFFKKKLNQTTNKNNTLNIFE